MIFQPIGSCLLQIEVASPINKRRAKTSDELLEVCFGMLDGAMITE